MKKTFIFLAIFLNVSLLAENHYQEEVIAIRSRTATLIAHGRERIDQLSNFKNAWNAIGFYSSELSELTHIYVDPRYYSEDPNFLGLHALTFEKVLIDTLQERLCVIIPKTETLLQTAESVVDKYPDLKDCQHPLKEQILTDLYKLNEVLNARKAQVEINLAMWRQWQIELALQAELIHQGIIADRLEVITHIGQVEVILHRLWLDSLQALYSRDFSTSKKILNSYSWFKSIVPLYFSDKFTTDGQVNFLKEVLDEATEKEDTLIAQYNLLTNTSSWELLSKKGGGHGSRDHGSERPDSSNRKEPEKKAPDKDNFPKDSKEIGDIATRMDPGLPREFSKEHFQGDIYIVEKLKIQKDVCKYDDAGQGSAKITIEGNGFVRYGANNDPLDKVAISSGPELQRAIDSGINKSAFHLEGSVPCDPKTEKEHRDFSDRMNHLDTMLDKAHQEAKKTEDKQGLEDIKTELNKFQNYQNLLHETTQEKITGINQVQNIAKRTIQGISKSLPSAPSLKAPPLIDRKNILDQLDHLRQSIWCFATSSERSISEALEGFIHSFTNQAPFQDVSKEVLNAIHQQKQPLKPIPRISYTPMTSAIRQSVLNKAKGLRDGSKIIKYSQTHRLGPDSYDCSGFVTSMYAEAGLSFGYPNVKGLIALTGTNGPFKEVSLEEAEIGDLVVWKKTEGKNTYDHVAIFDGEQTVHGEKGFAVISTSSSASKEGRNTIQEILIKYMMGDRTNPIVHIFQWVKH